MAHAVDSPTRKVVSFGLHRNHPGALTARGPPRPLVSPDQSAGAATDRSPTGGIDRAARLEGSWEVG